MKKLLFATCMGVLMLLSSCTSCKVNTDTTINVKSRKVQKFIELAREGDAEACKSLAICYRDGDGVEKSWINMVYMYEMYCNRSGEDVDNIVELFEEGEPFRLFCEILNIAEYNSEADAKFKQLEQLAPIEAKAITAAMDISAGKEVEQAFETIKEAEAQGSEAAVIFQTIRFEKEENETDYEKYLHKVAVKYPFLYQKLGAMANITAARIFLTYGKLWNFTTRPMSMACCHINTLTLCCIYMNISARKGCCNQTKRKIPAWTSCLKWNEQCG